MELDELQSNWANLTSAMASQQNINKKVTMELADLKFKNKWNAIAWPEFAGGLICALSALLIAKNFSDLSNFQLRVFGLASIIFLLIIPLLSYVSLQLLKQQKPGELAYLQSLKAFSGKQLTFVKMQGIISRLSIFLLIVFIPAFTKISTKTDISSRLTYWLLILPLCAVFFFIASKKVKKHYAGTATKMEALFHDNEKEGS
jgi:hypothetical protein